jgi:hypothetical protein
MIQNSFCIADLVSSGTIAWIIRYIFQVREMKRMLKSFMMKLQSRDAKEKIALEWRLVALALDRMFFYMYLVTIGVSIVTISVLCYSRYTELEQAAELLQGGVPV